MSVLDALDATRICARWSDESISPAAWTRPAPEPVPRVTAPVGRYTWWSLARNPHAMLVTGMIGAVLARDAMLRILTEAAGGN